MVQESFKVHYNPGKNQTVDEAVIGFKGRLSFVQYLPAKPIKCGMKVWMRCNSESAYLHEFDVYLGHQQNSIHGLAYDVVMKLCQHIAGKNHHLYCDNYFTYILLFTDLLNMKIYASGTIRQNKQDLPGEVKKPQICQILAKNPSKIVNHNILHTPSNVGVMVRKHFPIYRMKPCQLDW